MLICTIGMTNVRQRAGWLALAALMLGLGFVIGRTSLPGGDEQARPDAERGRKQSSRDVRVGKTADESRKSPDPGDAEALRQRTRAALTNASLREREVAINLVLDGITADNWKPVWNEFIRQTVEDGRTQDYEWSRTMRRIGEVAGAEAMKFFENSDGRISSGSRATILIGWASTDPEKAFEWIKSQPADGPNQNLWGAYVRGVSEGNPMFAVEHRAELPEELRGRAMAMAADGMVQCGNLQSAVATLSRLVADLPEGDPTHGLEGFYFSLKNRIAHMRQVAETYPGSELNVPDMSAFDARFQRPDDGSKEE